MRLPWMYTPLASIVILSKVLAENVDGNLTARQVEFTRAIRSAGTDLLNLVSNIRELSKKIESGSLVP